MNLLVTGGTGFLGAHLVPLLVQAGHDITVIGRTEPKTTPRGVRFVQGDLKDRAAVRHALDGVEAIYHLAGLVSFHPEDARTMYALHVDATRELLKDAAAAKVKRFILASTSGTTAVSKDERMGTEADLAPIPIVGRWPYYLSKIYEEQLALEFCRKSSLPLVVLNPSLLMGPGDERLSSTWTVMKFLSGDIPSMPNGGISFVDVRDAAAAFVRALDHGDLYGKHLMGVNMPMDEFFGRLSRLSGVPAPWLRLPAKWNVLGAQLLERWAKIRGTEAALDEHSVDIAEHFFYLDASKAEHELDFHARDPQETLKDTVQDLLARFPPDALPGTKGRLAKLRKSST